MFGSTVLEVFIGLFFVYLLLSLLVSALREGMASWTKTRAIHLERGIRELMNEAADPILTRALYSHPLIQCLYPGSYDSARRASWKFAPLRTRLPSYIPSRNFALALLDIAARGPDVAEPTAASPLAPPLSLATVRLAVSRIDNPPVQRALLMAIDTAGDDFGRAVSGLEAWYDSTMDRVSGWYKRKTHWILLALGLVAAVGLNVDTFALIGYLHRETAARQTLVVQATNAIQRDSLARAGFGAVRAQLEELELPIGWVRGTEGVPLRWSAIPGWLATALAISLGAPFWFDLLNKIMVVRSTVKPHEKSPEESSEDRQRPEPARSPPPAARAFAAREPAGAPAPPAPPAPPDMAAPVEPREWATGDPHEGVL